MTPARPYRPEVHGHRGCRGLRPENTVPAFLHALALGVDVLELDVVISADEQVVVSHEPWLSALLCTGPDGQQIATAEEPSFNLYQLPYTTIRRCDCGTRLHPGYPQQQLVAAPKPLLSEVFSAVDTLAQQLGRPPVRYSIELKSTLDGDNIFHPAPAQFTRLVLAQLRLAGVMERTAILCFDKRILHEVRRQRPKLPLCMLVEDELPFAHHLRELGFRPEVYGPHYSAVDAQLVAEVHTQQMRLVPWTVNEPEAMRYLLSLGVDGITTDYPDRLLALL